MSSLPPRRPLLASAIVNVVLHVVGLLLTAAAIAPGSPIAPLEARLAYLATRPVGWSVGWAVWMLCALALVWFLAMVRPHAAQRPATASLAVGLAAVGAAVDLYCDVLQIRELPRLASAGPALVPAFLAAERTAAAGGLVVANGLYSVAVLLIALSLRGELSVWALALAITTFVAGLLMVVAGLRADAGLLPGAAGATFAAFLAWVVSVTRELRGRA